VGGFEHGMCEKGRAADVWVYLIMGPQSIGLYSRELRPGSHRGLDCWSSTGTREKGHKSLHTCPRYDVRVKSRGGRDAGQQVL